MPGDSVLLRVVLHLLVEVLVCFGIDGPPYLFRDLSILWVFGDGHAVGPYISPAEGKVDLFLFILYSVNFIFGKVVEVHG